MILAAFTSPRNRLIPRKTVRVSSLGQQYVYRGIAPITKAEGASTETQVKCLQKKQFVRMFMVLHRVVFN